jgi:hypothetical protein
MPRVVHFEIAVDDPERVARFYTEVFGWQIQRWEGGEQDYWLVTTGEGEPGIDGGLMRRQEGMPGTVNTLGVPSLDEALEQVQAAGGAVAVPPMPISDMGRVAYCTDPGGTLFGLFEAAGTGGEGSSAG